MKMFTNKKGFTLVELIAVITVLLIIVLFAYFNFMPSYERGSKKALVEEAKIFSEGAINLYSDERVGKIYLNDVFASNVTNKRCYNIKSLIGSYVKKYDKNYSGSVEICYGNNCTYKTKIWLSDGKRYIDGVVTDDEITINEVSKTKSSQYFDSCNVDVSNFRAEYDFDYVGKEEVITIPVTATYALEGWGASGANAYIIDGPCGGAPLTKYGAYGSYSYTEVDLKAGDKLYIRAGGEGTFYTHEDVPGIILPGGYNGGGYSDYRHGGGGGATTIALKSGRINDIDINNILLVAGGGGGGMYEPGDGCHDGYFDGTNAGGWCTQGNVYNNGKYCNNDGYYGFQENVPSIGGGYNTSPGWHHWGGTGFIGNPLTRNGVMICLAPTGTQCSEPSEDYRKTIRVYEDDYSEEPVAMKAKKGNGYVKITKIISSNS